MAEHGTRTMYVHHGCRCELCCKAEHEQYLKRAEAKMRKRTRSKWSEDGRLDLTDRQARQRKYNAERWIEFRSQPSTHTKPLTWRDIAEAYDMRCTICNVEVNPEDTWIGSNGRRCYGRTYPTVDHIIPLKHGGSDIMDNVQLLCKHCNSSKGARINVIAI